MDKTSEMYVASKFKFLLKHSVQKIVSTSLSTKIPSSVSANSINKKQPNQNDGKLIVDASDKELKKLEAEEKKRKKEEKAKIMADICKPKEETLKKKKFEDSEKFENTTPEGKKKNMKEPMLDKYNPEAVECAWDSWWTETKIFEVSAEKAKKYPPEKRFTMILPPPNVTGSLHIGHSLMVAIEDCLSRYKRMKGFCSLWIPGTDHAGISCQSVVEKKLLKDEGKRRTDYTREAFVEKVYKWKDEHGGKIINQFRRLGVSFDWSRMYFTLDEERSKVVEHAFINLFDRGIIFRSNRIVNWCCNLRTAISDAELEPYDIDKPTMIKVPGYTKEVEFGVLVDFSYKLKSDPNKEIIISTTRIETMLGDVAVAVHSKDPRYKDIVGQKLIHPFFPNRELTIITDDELVDMEFGTGAVKITPAHDPNDFKCGKKHNLEMISIMDEEGIMNENAGMFKGLKRYDVRVKIEEELKKIGQFKDKKPNKMVIQLCYKTGDVIEPMLKPQWWVDCKDVAKKGLEAVRTNKLKIVPDFHKVTWESFLKEIQDWCISRQLWWGHRVPAYLIKIKGKLENPDINNNDHWVAAKSSQEAIEKAAKKFGCDPNLISVSQDEDVLDTWFSSGLFPLSLFGWPNEQNPDFKMFFPSTLMETGHDILFFWVARMVFFSLFMKDELPYETIYLHPLVKDAQGRKMSKSLGNVIDPLDVIDGINLNQILENLKAGNLPKSEEARCLKEKTREFPEGIPKCGADALRIGLMSYMSQGRNINLDIARVIGYRGFGNKIWNATLFFLRSFKDESFKPDFSLVNVSNKNLTFIDRWILNKLSFTIKKFESSMDSYNFGDAVYTIYSFWKDYFCDVYIEAVKSVFKSEDELQKDLTKNILFYIIDNALKCLHPIAPFITEELYQRIHFEVNIKNDPNFDQEKIPSIGITDFPTDISFINSDIDYLGTLTGNIVHRILSISQLFTLRVKEQKSKLKISFISEDTKVRDFIKQENILFATLSKVQQITVTEVEPSNSHKVMLDEKTDFFVDLTDFTVDESKDSKRLEGEIKEREKTLDDLLKKMTISGYEENASSEVKQDNNYKKAKYEKEISKLKKTLELNYKI